MRAYLEPWIVQDGQVPELRAGDVLREVGIAAACWSWDRSDGSDLCEALPGEDPEGSSTAHSVVDGVLVWREGDHVGVLQVHDMRIVVKGFVDEVALETFRRRPLDLPAVGQRIRVHAILYIMPAHEADLDGDGACPAVVRDWRVHAVHIERHAQGSVVSVETLDRMDAWTDEVWGDDPCGGEYLLDLSPT